MAPTLGYYDLRGLVDPIRFLLHHAGVEFEDKHYPIGPAPDYDRSAWFSVKFTLGFHFPNVPYYIDGDTKITQTLAILRYLGRKHDLIAKTDEELLLSDQVEQVLMETFTECFRSWYPKENYEPLMKALDESLPKKIEQLSKFLGDHKYLIGDRLTYVDFLMYSCLDYIRIYKASILEPAANLNEFMTRIESLPGVSAYLNGGKFHRKPICGPIARWGSTRD